MSNKQPWFKFYHNDWLNDGRLRMADPATRGIWVDMVCIMLRDFEDGIISGTIPQLAQLCGCTPEKCEAAIKELKELKIADVTKDNANVTPIVTVMSRRVNREWKARASTRLRVQKHRCNTDVTPEVTVQKSEVRSQKSENSQKIYKKNRFSKPTQEEVAEYLRTEKKMGNGAAGKMAQEFWEFYESKNWYVGKNKMSKWRMAASRWYRSNRGEKTTAMEQHDEGIYDD